MRHTLKNNSSIRYSIINTQLAKPSEVQLVAAYLCEIFKKAVAAGTMEIWSLLALHLGSLYPWASEFSGPCAELWAYRGRGGHSGTSLQFQYKGSIDLNSILGVKLHQRFWVSTWHLWKLQTGSKPFHSPTCETGAQRNFPRPQDKCENSQCGVQGAAVRHSLHRV